MATTYWRDWDDELKDFWEERSGFAEFDAVRSDPTAQELYFHAWEDPEVTYEQRMQAREDLREYFLDEFDLWFDDVFDWDAWRAEHYP